MQHSLRSTYTAWKLMSGRFSRHFHPWFLRVDGACWSRFWMLPIPTCSPTAKTVFGSVEFSRDDVPAAFEHYANSVLNQRKQKRD